MRARAGLFALVALACVGCGARSGLELELSRDGGVVRVDAGPPDAGPPDTGPPCMPSEKMCNGLDDDCDGRVDEAHGFGPIGEPIIVRHEGEGGDEHCTTCAIAFGPHAVSTSDGMLVAMRLGFDGSHPIPNTFVRRLDDDGHPRGELQLLFDRDTTEGLRMTTHPRGAAMVYCGRFGANDVTTSALLDPMGALLDERQREPRGRSCGAWEPDTLWTGTSTLFAWTDNSSGPLPGFEVLLDRGDEAGVSLGSDMLEANGDGGPRLAVAHGRVVLVVGVRNEPRHSVLGVHPRALDGTRARDPIYVEVPDGMDDSFRTSHVVPSREGFVVHSAAVRGRFVTQLGPDGVPLAPPVRFDDEADFVNGFDDVLGRAAGGAVIAGPVRDTPGGADYRVLVVGDDGEAVHAWDGNPDEGTPAWGGLVEHRGRLFFVYAILSGENRDQVRIRELGCVP